MADTTKYVAVRARIHGKVQGVWFRGWTEGEAKRLGVHGWVRNRQDGTVEALFYGHQDDVDVLLALCRMGPPAADVDKIETEPAQGMVPHRFEVKPTV
ncbi:MAG: acylphosphatase [Alphaproteobacteria bacterium]|nr:acylphosphatase [Alphaproteobacteria bacterium]